MIVKELIEILKELPPDHDVSIFWDGSVRGDIEGVVNSAPTHEVVLVGDWSIYREAGKRQRYPEEMIVYG